MKPVLSTDGKVICEFTKDEWAEIQICLYHILMKYGSALKTVDWMEMPSAARYFGSHAKRLAEIVGGGK